MLVPWKKSYDKPTQHIKKEILLCRKIHVVKAMGFPVVMNRCESWTMKKVERWKIDALKLWCWIRLLSISWTARRSNQLILKEINPEYSLEGLMLKLKPSLWPPDAKSQLTGKDPDAGKDRRQEKKGTTEDEMVGCTATSIEFEQVPGDGEGQGNLVCCSPWGHKELDTTEQLNKIFYFQIEVQLIDNIVSVSRSLRLFMFRLIHL